MGLRQLFAGGSSARAAAQAATDPAAAFLDRITGELARGPLNLPCFPDIVPRVRQALDDPKSTADDIVRIAGSEPRLSARLLQTASSVVFNPTGKPVPHLRAAVTRLGHEAVQSVAMVFAIQQMKAEPLLKPVAGPLEALWEKSIAVASACQTLARLMRLPTDKVFLVGLVHGIGHFYIIVRAAEAASGIRYAELPGALVAERHPAIGQAVLERWGFDAITCEAVGSQLDYRRLSSRGADVTDVLIGGVVLAEALLERDGDLAATAGVTAFERFELGQAELEAVLKHTGHSLDALRDALAG